MRMLLLALMIALLPLRGWVGDVMAMERVDQALTAVPGPAIHSDCNENRPPHGQVLAAQAELATASEDNSAHAAGDCAGCTGCQICHSVALAGMPSMSSPAQLPTAVPQTSVRRHASAERGPGFKPPIS